MMNNASVDTIEICEGDGIDIYAETNCNYDFYDDFDAGQLNNGWSPLSTDPMFNNPCPPLLPPASGIVAWIGSQTSFPRQLVTKPLILNSNLDYYVSFDMKYGDVQTSVNCEDPDSPNEGVHLQYSTDWGATWTDILSYIPTTNMTGPLYTWNSYFELVPQIANSPNTQIRWYQDLTSGFEWDHWGIDNVQIGGYAGATIVWSTGDTVFDPPLIFPLQTKTISCVVTDTIVGNTASDSVHVIVHPNPVVDLGVDTTLCYNTLFTLDAGNTGSTYYWSTGENTEEIIVNSALYDTTISYSVTVTDSYGCQGVDTINVTWIYCVSLDEKNVTPEISIFPNPNDGKCRLAISNMQSAIVMEIMNIHGQKIFDESIIRNTSTFIKEIDLTMFPKGVYFINFRGKGFTATRKLVIK
jgi:hypothetical protein